MAAEAYESMYSHDGAATLHLRLARRWRNGVTWLLFFMGSLRTAVNTEHLYDVKMQGNISTRGLDVPGKKTGGLRLFLRVVHPSCSGCCKVRTTVPGIGFLIVCYFGGGICPFTYDSLHPSIEVRFSGQRDELSSYKTYDNVKYDYIPTCSTWHHSRTSHDMHVLRPSETCFVHALSSIPPRGHDDSDDHTERHGQGLSNERDRRRNTSRRTLVVMSFHSHICFLITMNSIIFLAI